MPVLSAQSMRKQNAMYGGIFISKQFYILYPFTSTSCSHNCHKTWRRFCYKNTLLSYSMKMFPAFSCCHPFLCHTETNEIGSGRQKISLNCFQKARQLLVVWNIVYSLYTNLIKAFWQLYDSVPN